MVPSTAPMVFLSRSHARAPLIVTRSLPYVISITIQEHKFIYLLPTVFERQCRRWPRNQQPISCCVLSYRELKRRESLPDPDCPRHTPKLEWTRQGLPCCIDHIACATKGHHRLSLFSFPSCSCPVCVIPPPITFLASCSLCNGMACFAGKTQ